MRIASLLGALALAASMLFFFFRVWGLFPTPAQVAILITSALASFCAATWMDRAGFSPYFVKIAAMLAFTCFVLDVTMLGVIFNITPSDRAFLPWAALAILLAYTSDVRLLLVAGGVCALSFLSARVGTFFGIYWLSFGERPENFLVPAIALFTVPLWAPHRRYAGFTATYRILGMLAFFVPLLILAHWGDGSYLDAPAASIEHFYQVFGFVAAAGAIGLGIRRGESDVVNTGVTFFMISLYTKFYDWWWDLVPKYVFFFVIGATAVGVLLLLRRLRAGIRGAYA